MRRILILAVVLALPLAAAATAVAKKPDCSVDPAHPSCGEDPSDGVPLGGTVCDPADYPDGIDGVQTGDFDFTLEVEGDNTYACIDVLAAAGDWSVTVTGSRARSLLLVGRDSVSPGDACDVVNLRRDDIYIDEGHPLVMPAATINACGVDWSEWVGLETPELDVENHCVEVDDDADLCLVADMVDVAHPLVFQASMSGFSDASLTIHVDLP
jgi:hypothetical protein